MAETTEGVKTIGAGDALLVIDVQVDFCPGGALAIEGGDEIIPVLNRWIAEADGAGVPIFATRDWHPPDHVSFESRGGQWPAHCVKGTAGASLHPDLRLPDHAAVLEKGSAPDQDQYSAFDGTGLGERLESLNIRRIWIGGLALDVCVRASALDAARLGFETHVILDATRAIDVPGAESVIHELEQAGAVIVRGA